MFLIIRTYVRAVLTSSIRYQLFPRADIPKFRVLQNPSSLPESTLLIDQVCSASFLSMRHQTRLDLTGPRSPSQDVAYYRKADASEPTKTVNSLLTIERNSAGEHAASISLPTPTPPVHVLLSTNRSHSHSHQASSPNTQKNGTIRTNQPARTASSGN